MQICLRGVSSLVVIVATFGQLVAMPAEADDAVTPSDRVTTRLNVREEADAASDIVGKLEVNETAALLRDTTPFWYQIRLHNGVVGFISKSWSVRIPAPAGTDKRIRLGSWNIKKLGHGSSKDYPLVANVIESNFDIVAVVEVMQKGHAHPGYDSLLVALGSEWAALITDSPRPNDPSDGNAEFYAVFYRVGEVRPCRGWTEMQYHTDNDGGSSGTGADSFSREPAFACFEAGFDDGSVGFDFLLAAYHATFQGGVSGIKTEVGHLGEVFTSMANVRPGEGRA